MIDSHCHIDDPAFDDHRHEMLARARAAGVSGILVPGVRPATWARVAALGGVHEGIAIGIALGIHPWLAHALDADEGRAAADLGRAAAGAGAIAIGECGLDARRGERDAQEASFRAQIAIACELGLPLVVHVVGAHGRAAEILRAEGAGRVGGVIHGYSGGTGMIGAYRDLGFAFGFGAQLTRGPARKARDAAAAAPEELLLVETDGPDQSTGAEPGEPAQVSEIVAALAEARGAEPARMAAVTAANAGRVLRWSALQAS